MLCPLCHQPSSIAHCGRERTLHSMRGSHSVYIPMNYVCYKCPRPLRSSKTRQAAEGTSNRNRREKKFQSDTPEAMALLPEHVKLKWKFTDSGRVLCDTSVANHVRAMATSASWCVIADGINELKEHSWMGDVKMRYLLLCQTLSIQPRNTPSKLPKTFCLSDKWVRNLFVDDAEHRRDEVERELAAETGDEILVLDWTKEAAVQCGKPWLLNAMDGRGRALISRLTNTSKPYEAKSLILELARRGVSPKVAYVDDECCGAWKSILEQAWPGTNIRLDCFHAIRRLTQTVTSTQHPWFRQFCAELSEAVYTYDTTEIERLKQARERAGLIGHLKHARLKYVPCVITNAPGIIKAIEATLASFHERHHPEIGPLLTAATQMAWANLKLHIMKGCLCDPSDVVLNEVGSPIMIGDEEFRTIRTKRGASALEGFHVHQKRWLGQFAHHATHAGQALLAEGAIRWNRKRCNEAIPGEDEIPPVFAEGLLSNANELHQHLVGRSLYPRLDFVTKSNERSVPSSPK